MPCFYKGSVRRFGDRLKGKTSRTSVSTEDVHIAIIHSSQILALDVDSMLLPRSTKMGRRDRVKKALKKAAKFIGLGVYYPLCAADIIIGNIIFIAFLPVAAIVGIVWGILHAIFSRPTAPLV